MILFEEAKDKVMGYFSEGEYANEAIEAKKEFYQCVGVFDEESDNFEIKMALFIDWYLFFRLLSKSDQRPIDMVEEKGVLSSENKSMLDSLVNSRHSLFEFLKLKGEDVHVRDLFSGYKMILKKSPFTLGFNKDEIFEARLFPFEDSFVFSNAFCIHPSQAIKFIKKEIKTVTKVSDESRDIAREELIFKLLKMRFKIEQYKHLKLEDIYTNNSKLRF